MSAIDRFHNQAPTLSDPARAAFAITPSNDAPLPILPKAILVGTAGTVALRAVDSPADVTVTLAAGQILPVRALFVRATGTSAGALVGLA
jgi:hypothetical protein